MALPSKPMPSETADSSSAVRPSQVRTGNRIDTVKSRREGIAEVYTSLDLA